MSDALPEAPEPEILRWQAAAPESLVWAQWGSDCALFHVPSGKTHFLNAATARLLREVLDEPRDLAQILALLADGQDEDDRQAILASTAELLLHLENLGLVQAR